MIEYNFDEYPGLLSALRVRQQSHLNMAVTDGHQGTRPIACDAGKLHDQGQLHTVAFVAVGRLAGGVERLQELELVFRV